MADSQSTSVKTVFKVFLFTDLVGSTDLKKRLGDTAAAKAIGKHDALFRKSLKRFGGTEEDNAGDGFFASFDLPSEAVRCGLEFLSGLRSLRLPEPLHVRVGVHAGEIVRLIDGDAASSRGKLIGLAVDTGARVMGLAEGGQVLLTRSAFDSARQQFSSLSDGSSIQWLAHGPYLFKGVDDPLEVFEAGIQGFSPLKAPTDSEKARRAVTPGEEDTLGWRPAGGMMIPGRPGWRLEEKLGQGSFGEVWLARQERTKDLRSFKFCFHADRLRALKRELTLFRVMKEELGDRPDIARLYDVRVSAPPYFLEMDYTPAGDLARWAKSHGGIGAVPLEKRLKITAQVAQALSAAHSVGVIHKDIKPTNVLIEEKKDGSLQARLTDFGIGQLMNRKAVEEAGITVEGFTTKGSTGLSTPGSPTSGTRLYMAPELFAGKPPSARSDAYALGVMLYQMVVGDLQRHLGQGWERDVQDQLLREAIAALVDGDPARRLENVGDLTEHLERIEARRVRFEAKRRRRRRRILLGVPATLLLLVGVIFGYRELTLTPRWKAEALRLQREVTALGLATIPEEFNRKYPVTREGGFAIAEAGRILKLLKPPSGFDPRLFPVPEHLFRDADGEGDRQEDDADVRGSLEALTRFIDNAAGRRLDFNKTRAYLDDNRIALARMISLARGPDYRELNSYRDYDRERPVSFSPGRPGPNEDFMLGPEVRIHVWSLLPAAIHAAAKQGDIDRAYDILISWLYFNKAIMTEGDTLDDIMVGGPAIDRICHVYAAGLIMTFPPDRASALRLFDILDPREARLEYIRGLETEFMYVNGLLLYLAGELDRMPGSFSPVVEGNFLDRFLSIANVRRIVRPEAWEAIAVNYQALEMIEELFPLGSRGETQIDDVIGDLANSNFLTARFFPSLIRYRWSAKMRLQARNLLRAALLLRVEEIDGRGNPDKMPATLKALFARHGYDEPVDYLGETFGWDGARISPKIEYITNSDDGSYILRQTPDVIFSPTSEALGNAAEIRVYWGDTK